MLNWCFPPPGSKPAQGKPYVTQHQRDGSCERPPFRTHVRNPGRSISADSGTTQRAAFNARRASPCCCPIRAARCGFSGNRKCDLEAVCDRCLGPRALPCGNAFRPLLPTGRCRPSRWTKRSAIDEGEAEIGFYEMPGLRAGRHPARAGAAAAADAEGLQRGLQRHLPGVRREPQRDAIAIARASGASPATTVDGLKGSNALKDIGQY